MLRYVRRAKEWRQLRVSSKLPTAMKMREPGVDAHKVRADRATAVSDIIVRMAADDIRHLPPAAAHGMSVNVWSAFLAETRFRAKIATWVARFGRDLPSHHVVDGRRFFLALTGLGAIETLGQPHNRVTQYCTPP